MDIYWGVCLYFDPTDRFQPGRAQGDAMGMICNNVVTG